MTTSVIYINWDGFAKYYLDLALKENRSVETIRFLIEKGTYYENAHTLVPSITNPMQASIVSGVGPRHTDNHFMHYDRRLKKVVRENPKRKNYAETIAEALARQGLSLMSINQFAVENRGSSRHQVHARYVRVEEESGLARFDYLIDFMKKEKKLPDFIAIYLDELDSIGHNHFPVYGYPIAKTELERQEQILDCLEKLDTKLGEVLETAKEEGVLDRLNIILTSDHGMTSYGKQSKEEGYYRSHLPELIQTLKEIGFQPEFLREGESLQNETSDLVLTTVGQQVLLTHLKDDKVFKNQKIIQALSKKDYIGKVFDQQDLIAKNVKQDFADLIISPKPPASFQDNANLYFQKPRCHHDSLDASSQRVPLILWGRDIHQGLRVHKKVYVQSVASSIAYLLDVLPPFDAYYPALLDAMTKEVSSYDIHRYEYQKANAFNHDADRVDLVYKSREDCFVSFYRDGKRQTRLFFPNTWGKWDRKTINFPFEKNDVYSFLHFEESLHFKEIFVYTKHSS